MAFYVGQKVVCIDVEDAQLLIKGNIYTVSAISFEPMAGETGIELYEVAPRNTVSDFSTYRPSRFRPVVKTDISIFTAMLNTKQRELVK